MKHLGTKTIDTDRITLRPFTVEDADAMFRNWASDPEVTKYLMWPTHSNVDISRMVLTDWVSHYEEENYYQWAIVLKELDEPIGCISVVNLNDKVQKAEIGYCIGKTWWRCGYTSEALLAVMKFLFEEVGFRRVEARHDTQNPNSGKVMAKCGMQFEGILRQSDWNNQGICDTCSYSMLYNEWFDLRSPGQKK